MKNTKAFGLVEVIVSVLILSIVAVGIGYFVTSNKEMSVRIGNSQECSAFAETLVGQLKSKDNKLEVLNHLQETSATSARAPAPFDDGSGVFRNFQNIESATTILYQLYRANNSACSSAPTDRGIAIADVPDVFGSISALDTSNLPGYVKVTPLKADGSTASCTDINSLGITNTTGTSAVTQLKATIWVDFKDPQSQGWRSCSAEATVGYESDTSAPSTTLGTISGVRGAAVVGMVQPVNTICDTGNVNIGLQGSEAGMMFLCASATSSAPTPSPVATPTGSWVNCETFQLAGVEAGLVLTGPAQNAPTVVTLSFPDPTTSGAGLLDGQYRFFVRGIDTGGNLSSPVEIFFTVDLNSPTWQSQLTQAPDPATSQYAVGFASQLPVGTELTVPADNAVLAQFGGTQKYQCALNSNPRFRGAVGGVVFGNEFCDALTASAAFPLNNGKIGTGAFVAGNLCEVLVSGASPFEPGTVSLTATVKDVCNNPPNNRAIDPTNATRTTDWAVDPDSTNNGGIGATALHSLGSNIVLPPGPTRIPVGPYPNSGPTFRLGYTRTITQLQSLPVVWEIPHANETSTSLKSQGSGGGANPPASGIVVTTADQAWTSQSCVYSGGFCSKLYTGCGDEIGSRNYTQAAVGGSTSYYAVKGTLGQSCWQVPCETGLMCDYRVGRCVARTNPQTSCGWWRCTNHSDCSGGGNECTHDQTNLVHNAGVCNATDATPSFRYCAQDGDCAAIPTATGTVTPNTIIGKCVSGRCECPDHSAVGKTVTQPNTEAMCPDMFAGFCGGVAQQINCDNSWNSRCPSETGPNLAGVPDSCRGRDPSVCLTDVPGPVQANCRIDTTEWLGLDDIGKHITQVKSGWAAGGYAPYKYYCSFTDSTPDRTAANEALCNLSTLWPESPNKPASPNLPYHLTVEDSRNDYISCSGSYKFDRQVPFFKPGKSPVIINCGDTSANPRIGDEVDVSYESDDTHTFGTISSANVTSIPIVAGEGCATPACVINVPVTGVARSSSPESLRLVLVDQAANSITANLNAYVAVDTGFTVEFTDSNASTSWGNKACPSGTCSVASYQARLDLIFRETNNWNWSAGVSRLQSWTPTLNVYAPATFTTTGVDTSSGQKNVALTSIPEGQHFYRFKFRDSCGNESTHRQDEYFIDWFYPQWSAGSPACNPNARTITVNGGDGNGSGYRRFRYHCTDPNGTVSQGTNPTNNIISDLPVGTTTCVLNLEDISGHTTKNPDGRGGTDERTISCTVPPPPDPCPGIYDLGDCSPNPCGSGTMCDTQGACYACLPVVCDPGWALGVCSSNPCTSGDTVCQDNGQCYRCLSFPPTCASIGALDGSCSPNPCTAPNDTCNSAGGPTPVCHTCSASSGTTSGTTGTPPPPQCPNGYDEGNCLNDPELGSVCPSNPNATCIDSGSCHHCGTACIAPERLDSCSASSCAANETCVANGPCIKCVATPPSPYILTTFCCAACGDDGGSGVDTELVCADRLDQEFASQSSSLICSAGLHPVKKAKTAMGGTMTCPHGGHWVMNSIDSEIEKFLRELFIPKANAMCAGGGYTVRYMMDIGCDP